RHEPYAQVGLSARQQPVYCDQRRNRRRSGDVRDHRGRVRALIGARIGRTSSITDTIMPLVRIDLLKGRTDTEVAAIGAAVHRALVECLNVPERDHFQVITEHDPGRLVYDPGYLEIRRTDGIVMVQVFLSAGRTTEQKQAFYARAAELLAREAK